MKETAKTKSAARKASSFRFDAEFFQRVVEFLPDATLIIDGEGKVIA